MTEYKYPLSNQWKGARERLSQIEAVFDPWTIRNFAKLGVQEGWHCLEVAGGGGSIAEWLCRQTGNGGRVVATDLQTHFLEAINAPNLEVRQHDILSHPLPEQEFDLVHARAVLTFLPRPAEAITKMVAALKPGGWLLLEEPDYISAIPDPSMDQAASALSQKAWNALLDRAQSLGYDTGFGRRLYHDLAINDLGDIQAEGYVAMQLGGMPSARIWKITMEQMQDHVLAAGLLTTTELEDYRALLDSSEYRWMAPVMMSAWGRRVTTL
jgi:SAM-dependent methyltransferase